MGFPEIKWELRAYPCHKKGPSLRYHPWLDLTIIFLTLAILLAYVLGIIGFAYVLGPWTETNGTLYWRNHPQEGRYQILYF